MSIKKARSSKQALLHISSNPKETNSAGWVYCIDIGGGFLKVGATVRTVAQRHGYYWVKDRFLFAIADASKESAVHRLLSAYRYQYVMHQCHFCIYTSDLSLLRKTKENGAYKVGNLEVFKASPDDVLKAMASLPTTKKRQTC